MTLCSVPMQGIVPVANAAQTITVIELNNIFDHLSYGAAPAFTTYLSANSAMFMTISDEAWAIIGNDDGVYRNAGDVMPYPATDEEEYYSYFVLLKADEGYEFTDDFQLYYDGEQVSMMDYDYTLYSTKDRIVIRCDFIGLITPDYSTAAVTEIRSIGLNNVCTDLRYGEAPSFTAYLSPDSALQMTLANEAWAIIDREGGILRSRGDVFLFPENGEEEYYSYFVQLKADEGYVFTDDFTLSYDGEQISVTEYDYTLYESKDTLVIRCDFLGTFTPSSGPKVIDAIYIEDVCLDFSDGDIPLFTATPAQDSQCYLITEGWRGSGEAVFSVSGFNTAEYLGTSKLLTAFRGGENYTYFIRLACADGYMFDYTGSFPLYINGVEYPYHLNVMQSGVEIQVADLLSVPAAVTTVKTTTATTAKTTTVTTEKATTATTVKTTTLTTSRATTATTVKTTAKQTTTESKNVTTTTGTIGTAPEIPGLLRGDINRDGRISVQDQVLMIRLMTQDEKPALDDYVLAAADIDRDRTVTLTDYRLLMRMLTAAAPDEKPVKTGKMPFSEEKEQPPAVSKVSETPNGGNSDPFRITPLPGLTVSAEKNALKYNGQLRFSMLQDEDLSAIDDIKENFGLDVVAGWHADAGLAPDEYLPGSFHSEFDLRTLDYIPEELYDSVTVVRYDEEGGIKLYDVKRDGSMLSWDSPQNCVIFICTIVLGFTTMIGGYVMSCGAIAYIGALVAIGATVAWVDYEVMTPADAWAKNETKHLAYYDKDGFYIWYSDPDAEARLVRIKDAETKAREKAEAEIERQYKDYEESLGLEDISISVKGKMRMEQNADAAVLTKQYLDADKQYQTDIKARDEAPEDVVLLYESLREAREYLMIKQGMPEVGFTMNVLYCYGLADDGQAETPKALWRNPYLVLRRRTDIMTNTAEQHNLEITCVHEMYHLYQARYMDSNNEANLKFMEMSAIVVEHQFANSKGYSSNDMNSKRVETYSIGIDDQRYEMDARRSEGYTLSRYVEFLDECAGGDPISGIELAQGYKNAGFHFTRMLRNYFKFSEIELAESWEYYLQYINEQLWERYRQIGKEQKGVDDGDIFPSCMKKHPLNENTMKKHFDVSVTPFSCKGIYCRANDAKALGVFMVPDEGLEDALPMFSILPLNEPSASKSEWIDTSKGTGITVNTHNEFIYAERQGINGCRASGYTLYYIPQPATPKVDFIQDEDNLLGDYYEVKLQSKCSTAGEDGITEYFLIRIYAGDEVLLEQLVEFEEWDQKQIIYPDNMKKPTDHKAAPTITVCEYFRDEATGAEYYGPESVKVPLENEFPVLNLEGESAGCTYGVGAKQEVYISGGVSGCSFTLQKDGRFTFTYPEKYHEWDNLKWSTPFVDPSAGHYSGSGFTVTGRVQNVPDVNNWTGDLVSCTPNTFSAEHYEEIIPLIIDVQHDAEEIDLPDIPINTEPAPPQNGASVQDVSAQEEDPVPTEFINESWSGSGMQSGSTLTFETMKSGTLHVTVCIITSSGNVVANAYFDPPSPTEE